MKSFDEYQQISEVASKDDYEKAYDNVFASLQRLWILLEDNGHTKDGKLLRKESDKLAKTLDKQFTGDWY